MAIEDKLGSFPNSQIRPRSAVKKSTMIDIALVADTETQILSENKQRVKAIIKNNGTVPVDIDYTSGPSDSFRLLPTTALVVEGTDDDVFATAIGGAGSLEIDERLG